MTARQQAAAGQRVDWTGVPLIEQRIDRVHDRQAGTDQRHGSGRRELGQRVGSPGIQARTAERGLFDGIFLADIVRVYDVYRDSPSPSIRDTV